MGVWSRLDLDDTARIGVGEMTYYINNKGDIQDLQKAVWYINDEIKRLQNEKPNS